MTLEDDLRSVLARMAQEIEQHERLEAVAEPKNEEQSFDELKKAKARKYAEKLREAKWRTQADEDVPEESSSTNRPRAEKIIDRSMMAYTGQKEEWNPSRWHVPCMVCGSTANTVCGEFFVCSTHSQDQVDEVIAEYNPAPSVLACRFSGLKPPSEDKPEPPPFEVGKFYVHNSGKKIAIRGKLDTTMYGLTLIAEEDTGDFVPVGEDPAYNYHEITEAEWLSTFTEDSDGL